MHQIIRDRNLTAEVRTLLETRRDGRLQHLQRYQEKDIRTAHEVEQIELELIFAERRRLYELLRQGKISDGTRRVIKHELDLQEARLAGHAAH